MGRFLDWGVMGARGAVGGVIVFWDKRVLQLDCMGGRSFQFYVVLGESKMASFRLLWGLQNQLQGGELKGLWTELGAIKGLWEDPWCVERDFNIARFPTKRSSGDKLSTTMRRLLDIIEELEL